ncbi:MAG: D-alanyl-D-alanine carboxypeptidase family protein [Candidatus Vogelbacteria bacterium]|nr:D-alanyl-D-alanine carboxypeptidase family protein [Candidatus Vogelbacteria bacterium]
MKSVLHNLTAKYLLATLGAILLAFAGAAYGGYHYYNLLAAEMVQIRSELASTTVELQTRISELQSNLASIQNESAALNEALRGEQEKSGAFEKQIGAISNTVGTLEKLSQTDKELLQKYSKVYFLNEHYVPTNLLAINAKYLYDPNKPLEFHARVWPYLEKLLAAAVADGVSLQIASAYRSFGTQSALKSSYTVTYGAGSANKFSADQGYSEHQLGTTVDLTIRGAAPFTNFEKTAGYKWLTANGYQYGFILSYPKGNAYYQFEPWHWRFVGMALASKLHSDQAYFYDLDQREIDKYLVTIFD